MVNLLSAFKVHPDPFGNLPPKETVNARIIALALFGSCAAVLFGYDLGKLKRPRRRVLTPQALLAVS